jgi:transposase
MSDAEWTVCEPLLPHSAWLAGKGGRPSGYCMRDIVDGIRYLTHNGPVWRALPADFPPAWTVYWWAAKWQADGSTETMHGAAARAGKAAGRAQARADGGDHRLPVGPGCGGGFPGQPRIRRREEGERPLS